MTKKLTILVRVEPGCLGPTGKDYVEDFCTFANPVFSKIRQQALNWQLVPRYDKSLDEVELQLEGRKLTPEQAEKYLSMLDTSFTEISEDIGNKLSICIDKFFEAN